MAALRYHDTAERTVDAKANKKFIQRNGMFRVLYTVLDDDTGIAPTCSLASVKNRSELFAHTRPTPPTELNYYPKGFFDR